jgi:hypothetical protein
LVRGLIIFMISDRRFVHVPVHELVPTVAT